MKKSICSILCAVMAFTFSACSKDCFMDVYAFTYYYNKAAVGNEIALEDYLCYNGTYSIVLEKESTRLHLALEESEECKIEEIRLLVAKADEKGVVAPVSESARSFFSERLRDVLVAYTNFTQDECIKITEEMKLDKLSSFTSDGELTLTKRDWHMVYYSNEIASVFMITNVHLHPTEKTEKPVSKPDFGNTAYTRAG